MTRIGLAAILLLAAPDWKIARPDFAWSFPRDHWAHEGYRTEWWYFTGHLGDRFAYQFTLFRIGVLRERPALESGWAASHLVMGHAALTDLRDGRHLFGEVLHREIPLLAQFHPYPERRIGWSRAPAGSEGLWYLEWNGEGFDFAADDDAQGFGFDLTTRATKPVVFQGPNGFSRKGDEESAASQYYSFTRLETSGVVRMGGERHELRGESWMDKEFSSSHLGPNQVGWDWFSLRLEDGRDLMLYVMRAEDGSVDYASGTIVAPDGAPRYLDRSDFEIEVLRHWTSPESAAEYPVRWRIRALDLDLEVSASVEDQENRSRVPGGVHYWEGAVEVRIFGGPPAGRGFVELTGYGAGNRPPV